MNLSFSCAHVVVESCFSLSFLLTNEPITVLVKFGQKSASAFDCSRLNRRTESGKLNRVQFTVFVLIGMCKERLKHGLTEAIVVLKPSNYSQIVKCVCSKNVSLEVKAENRIQIIFNYLAHNISTNI